MFIEYEVGKLSKSSDIKYVMYLQNAHLIAQQDAQRQHSRSRACSFARSVAPSACVCLLELMETNNFVLVTITGKPREEDPNALEELFSNYLNLTYQICMIYMFFLCSFVRIFVQMFIILWVRMPNSKI